MGGGTSSDKGVRIDESKRRVVQVESAQVPTENQAVLSGTNQKKQLDEERLSAQKYLASSQSSGSILDVAPDRARRLSNAKDFHKTDCEENDSLLSSSQQPWIEATASTSIRKQSLDAPACKFRGLTISKYLGSKAPPPVLPSPVRGAKQASGSPSGRHRGHQASPATNRGRMQAPGKPAVSPNHPIDLQNPLGLSALDIGGSSSPINISNAGSRPVGSTHLSLNGVKLVSSSSGESPNPSGPKSKGSVGQLKPTTPSIGSSPSNLSSGHTPKTSGTIKTSRKGLSRHDSGSSHSRSKTRSDSSSKLSAIHSAKTPPNKGGPAAPRPPGSGQRGRHSSNSSDPARHLRMRRTPSFSGGASSNSCDESDDYGAVFTDNATTEPPFTKPAVIPPLHLNGNSKNVIAPFISRVIGMGLAPQGLRINTTTCASKSSEAVIVTPSSSALFNQRLPGQASQFSTATSDRPSSFTPNSTGTSGGATRPTPTSMGTPLYEVKETNDVKRNRAKLPPTMIHAKPTTGDWLKKRYIVNNYILLDTLGTGSYGEVRLCKDRTTDNLFAIKIISKEMLKKRKSGNTTETYFEDIRREIAIMKKLLHPNVLRLYEVLDDPNVNKMYLVLEYMKKGDLINVLKDRENNATPNSSSIGGGMKAVGGHTVLSDLELWNIFRQIVAGVRYLHYQNVVHGDIKPQNLLVGENGIVKIADFGISKMLSNSDEQLGNAAGTPAFMSPELCAAEAFSGQLADIWALGATVFMLKYGHPPFVAGNLLNLYNKIQNDPLVFPPQMKISPGLQDLLENMLRKDPNERFTLDKVILHPWMRYPPPNPATAAALAAAANACADRGDSASVALAIPGIKARIRASPRVVPAEISADHVPIRAQFTPPDSYNDEEAAAMEGPVKEVNNEDMYKSIGVSVVGKTRSSRRKSKSSASSSACVSEKVSQHENMEKTPKDGESDMMLSGWGADVFEIIDVGESNNSDSDDDSDDAEDSVVATKHVTTAVNSFNVTSTRVSKAVSDKDIENIFSVVTVGEDEKEGSDSSSDEDKSKGKAVKEEIPRAPSRMMSEQLAPLAKYDMAGMDDTLSRGSMGADEENFRASRFRSQLSKRSIKEAISKEMRSKKNVLECLSSGRSSQMSSPFRIGTPPSNPARNLNLRPPGCVATPSKREVDGVASYVRTVDVEEECTGELSMEEFRTMMDTLATVGGPRDRSVEDSEADPVDLTLDALDFSSQLMNMNSGVGVAFHSEKGQREFQEDRCCLVPDVAEMNMREAMEQAGGQKSRRGSFLNSVQKETEDQLHKITVTCLFDGHSGSVCSEYLSKHFAKILVNHEKFLDSSPEAALIDVCRQIDGQVCDKLIEDDDLSGSTGVVVVYDGRKNMLTLANVGDSMCVLSRGGRAINVHRMHRLDDADERARVEAAGGTIIKNRVNGVLAVSRAFGDTRFKDTNSWREGHAGASKGPVIAVPDVYSELCTPLTEFCIIATDGLWDVMSPQLAVNFVRTKLSEKCDLQVCAKELVNDAVRNKGSVDNVTVILLSFHTLGTDVAVPLTG